MTLHAITCIIEKKVEGEAVKNMEDIKNVLQIISMIVTIIMGLITIYEKLKH